MRCILPLIIALAQPGQRLILVTIDGLIWLAVMSPDVATSGEQSNGPVLFQNQIAATLARLLGFDFKSDHPIGPPITSLVGSKR